MCVLQEMGASFKVGDIPADLMDSAMEWREKLLEQVAEMDDDVMEKYLDVSCCYIYMHSSNAVHLAACMLADCGSDADGSGPFAEATHQFELLNPTNL